MRNENPIQKSNHKIIKYKDNYKTDKKFNENFNSIDDQNKKKIIKNIEEKKIKFEKKYKKQRKTIYLKTINKTIINCSLIIYLFFLLVCIKEISNYATEITITIEGTGIQPIIYSSNIRVNYTPDQILLNNDPLDYTGTSVFNLINEINNITMIWNRQLYSCNTMFYGLRNLIYADLSKFDCSQVTLTTFMFDGCSSLKSVNLKNLNTSSVESMAKMFHLCSSLISLDLSYINTSSVTSIETMFGGCESLESLDLSNLNISKVEFTNNLFEDCYSLTSLNLNNLDTSNVRIMDAMFYNCYSLTSLNLIHFNTSNSRSMYAMFAGCSSLISLDLNNFDTSSTFDMTEMFSECSSLKFLNIANFNTSNVYTFSQMFYGCSSLQSLDLTKFIFMDDPDLEIDNMFSGCNFNLTYCINDIMNPELSSLLTDFINNCSYICSTNPNKKFIIQDNICLDECKDYQFEYNKKCYEQCPNGTKPSLTNEFLCEIRNDETQETRNDTSQETRNDTSQECNIADAFNNNCKVNNSQENVVKNIKKELKNGTLDSLISNLIDGDKKDLIITENNMVYQITTTDNQNNKEYYNISTIRLGDCENILKIMHGIDLNVTLLIFKIDYYPPGSLIPIVNYEVLHPVTKEKLKLDYCNDEMIDVNLPVSNDFDGKDLFKYDLKSDYYTDICFKHTTENGTDILLNDRYKEYNENNMALCENNCDLEKYDENSKQVTCECKVKINDLENPGILDNTDSLYNNFTDNDLSSNMISMKCSYTLFSEEGMILNIASYIFITFILSFVVSGVLFYKFGYPSLELIINEIITKKQPKKRSSNKTLDYKEKDSNNKEIIKKDSKKKTTKKKKKTSKLRNIYNDSNNQKQPSIFSSNTFISKTKLEIHKDSPIIHKVKKKLKKKGGHSVSTTKKKNININEYNDFELNHLLYVDALDIDHRSYIDYYLSLIKTKHPIIMIFTKDYNTKIIKINLIFVSFSLQYLFNGLFFNESTIHQIYVDKGAYNISYLMKYIIISFIISHILTIVVKKFSLSEKNICNIKKHNNAINAFKASDEEKKSLTIKYICFYAIFIGLFAFFWYYLSSFGAVYQNSQIHLIKNVLITFGISLIYPFIYNFLPGICRINSLKNRQNEGLYKISEIMQLL